MQTPAAPTIAVAALIFIILPESLFFIISIKDTPASAVRQMTEAVGYCTEHISDITEPSDTKIYTVL